MTLGVVIITYLRHVLHQSVTALKPATGFNAVAEWCIYAAYAPLHFEHLIQTGGSEKVAVAVVSLDSI